MTLIRIDRHPTTRQLRVFAVGWIVALGFLGFLLRRWLDSPLPAAAVWLGAVAVPLAGMVHRPVLRWAWLALAHLAYPIGWAVSHLVLAAVYFLLVTPIGLVLRALGHDPLARRPDPGADSHWRRREPPAGVEDYLRQF